MKNIKKIFLLIIFILLWQNISYSNIQYYKYSDNPKICIIAGIHGDEKLPCKVLLNMKKYEFQKKSVILIPIANLKAYNKNVRYTYDTMDLNNSFFQKSYGESQKISDEIIKLLNLYKFNLVLDLHESSYVYDETKDAKYYLGNTIIADEYTILCYNDLILKFIDLGFTLIESNKIGSLSYEIPKKLKIPVITVEFSKEEKKSMRKKKIKKIVDIVINYEKFNN